MAAMPLHVKSVHTPPRGRDGLRILAARFRGRRLPSSAYDVWMPSLGPSEALLREVQAGLPWLQFERRFIAELFEEAAVDERSPIIKNHGQKFTLRLIKHLARDGDVTLMCHCAEDEVHCHRHTLRRVILSSRV